MGALGNRSPGRCLLLNLPLFTPVRQIQKQPVIADVADDVRRQWSQSRLASRLAPGSAWQSPSAAGHRQRCQIVKTTLEFCALKTDRS